MSTDVG
jgi:hypothetical protein